MFLIFLLFPFFLCADVIDEMTYIAEHHLHGYRDDYLSYEKSKKVMEHGSVHKTCGSISLFTIQYLAEKGVKSRFILFLTLEDWNAYSNGHSLVEVYNNTHWELWDIDLKNYFMKKGKILNALQLCKASMNSSFEIVSFSNSEKLAYGDLSLNGTDYTSLSQEIFLTKKGMRNFYKRCCQVVLIMDAGSFYFTSSLKDKKRIESYMGNSFIYLDEKAFLNKFYNSKR